MKIEQIYTGCLAQGAYFIESNGETAIIDPLRESEPYIEKANILKSKIKYIFETHIHADFVSGYKELAEKTKAKIVFGPNATISNKSIIKANDNEEFRIGDLTIKVLHTPGHTLESICLLLSDKNNHPQVLFTGDTLFIGDVGRPDLIQKGSKYTKEDYAGFLFESIKSKILPLPNHITIYPAHGAGSLCGKNMDKATFDTLGNQKQKNYALNPKLIKKEFIKILTQDLPSFPSYFLQNVKLNQSGAKNIEDAHSQIKELEVEDLIQLQKQTNAVILDVRPASKYLKSNIPKSIFIGLEGNFAPMVGNIFTDINQPLILITDENKIKEACTRLSRIGFDNVLGVLKGGYESWIKKEKEINHFKSISPEEFIKKYKNKNTSFSILDVRNKNELLNSGNLKFSYHIPLHELLENTDKIGQLKKPIYVHCAGGYRSAIAISVLSKKGISPLINIEGGFSTISKLL